MCSIRDRDLRLIQGKQVESYENLPQMEVNINVPTIARQVAIQPKRRRAPQ
jgi:hypothetical protein